MRNRASNDGDVVQSLDVVIREKPPAAGQQASVFLSESALTDHASVATRCSATSSTAATIPA
jgi:hypothetical protein